MLDRMRFLDYAEATISDLSPNDIATIAGNLLTLVVGFSYGCRFITIPLGKERARRGPG